MRIAFDAAGAASARAVVEGALRAASDPGCEVLLVGPEGALRAELQQLRRDGGPKTLHFLDAPSGSAAAAAEQVASGKASAFVSAGPPREAVSAAVWHLKRLKNVLRPALAARFPTRRGASILLDAGANADSKPWHLLQFAVMGSLYFRALGGTSEAGVALVSSPAGEGKGTPLIQESLPLLKFSSLKFVGPMEPAALLRGEADVALTEGFVGDILLGWMSAVAGATAEMIESAPRGILSKLLGRRPGGAALDALARLKDFELEPMALLGVDAAAALCRTPASAESVWRAIKLAKTLLESGLKDEIRDRLSDLKSSLEFAKMGE